MTASQIARHLGLQRQSVQRTVDNVRWQGLVEVQPTVDRQRAGSLADLTMRVERATAHGRLRSRTRPIKTTKLFPGEPT